MYKILFSILLVTINLAGSSQQYQLNTEKELDSLRKLMTGAKIERQIDIMNLLAAIYAPMNFDSSTYYSSMAMRMATIQNYSYGVACSRLYTGNAYYYKMDFKNALVSYLSAQTILEEGPYFNQLSELFLMMGHINFFIMRTEIAISYYQRSLGYRITSGNEKSVPEVFYALSLTFWREGTTDSALVYCDKLLKYSQNYNDLTIEALAITLIGQNYIDEKAITYYNEALKIAIKLNNYNLISSLYNNIASNYDRSSPLFETQGDLKQARSYYDRALIAANQTDYNSILQPMITLSLAEIDIEEGKFQQAEANLSLCKAKLDAFNIYPEKQSSPAGFYSFGKIYDYYLMLRTRNYLYNALHKLAQAEGEFTKAIEYLHLFYQSKDTLYAAQQGRQLELLMTEAEAERTDQKIRSLAQESQLNQLKLTQNRFIFSGIAAFVVMLSLFILIYFQRKRLIAEQRSILNEQRLLRAQMNPHFLFNSLASIQNYMINEDADKASIYLSRFSQLIRNILDNSVEEYVPLEKEIETIRNYLELQKVRYAAKFDFLIDIDTGIDIETVLVPPMLAQPFIENAIEHGIKHKEGKGNISIRIKLEEGIIRFEVEDDGVGREKSREIEAARGTRHRSMATSITTDRLATLNKKLKKKIRLEIEDLKDGDRVGIGTKVRFGIPIRSVEG